jgi:hypothetical protein
MVCSRVASAIRRSVCGGVSNLDLDFLGSDECPNLGYLAGALAMFDRFEHELAAFAWLEYHLSPTDVKQLLAAFPGATSLITVAQNFEGTLPQVLTCNLLETKIPLPILEEFWDRFMRIKIDQNTLILNYKCQILN